MITSRAYTLSKNLEIDLYTSFLQLSPTKDGGAYFYWNDSVKTAGTLQNILGSYNTYPASLASSKVPNPVNSEIFHHIRPLFGHPPSETKRLGAQTDL